MHLYIKYAICLTMISKKMFFCLHSSQKQTILAAFLKLGFTPCKAEQTLQGMELQEKKHKKDYRIQKICLERT